MTLPAANQLVLSLDVGLAERHRSLLDCVRQCIYTHRNPLKTVAADMDLSESQLSRKLSINPHEPRHFNVDDLEAYIAATGDTTPILYLCEKYMQLDESKQKQAIAALAQLLPDIAALIKQARLA